MSRVQSGGVLADVTNTSGALMAELAKGISIEESDLKAKLWMDNSAFGCQDLRMDAVCSDSESASSCGDQFDDDMVAIVDDTSELESDPQRVSEYAADIYVKLGRDEKSQHVPQPNYMKTQPDLDASVRASTVDWLVGVQMKYKLKTETLFLAVSILDRFLATRRVQRKDLQLVSCTAAFIAAKFEETDPPEVRDFVHATDQHCRKEAILAMEVTMLTALEFCLCQPTAAHYLQRYQQGSPCSQTHASLLQYILELALLDLRMTRFSPSLQAAAASMVSSWVLNLDPSWSTSTLGQSDRLLSAVQRCAEEMISLLRDADQVAVEVRKKFSSAEFNSVAISAF